MMQFVFWSSLALFVVVPWEGMAVGGLGTPSRALGLVVGSLWICAALLRGRMRRPTFFHLLVLLFVVWNAVSLFWTVDSGRTQDRVISMAQMLALTVMIWDLYDTPQSIRIGLQALVIGSFVPVASTISNYLSGQLHDWGRYAASGMDANKTAIVVTLAVPLAVYLLASARKTVLDRMLWIVNAVYVVSALFAIGLTATRFAIVMLAPVALFALGFLPRSNRSARILVPAFLLAVAVAVPSLMPETTIERIVTLPDEIRSGSLNDRTFFWQEGLEVWYEHPIAGAGANTFQSAAASGRSAHNSFVAILAELGLVGLLLLGAVVAWSMHLAWQQPRPQARFWLTVLVVWLLGNLPLTMAHSKATWVLLGLLMASVGAYPVRVLEQTRARRPEPLAQRG